MAAPSTPWNGTPAGQRLQDATNALQTTYSQIMPKHIQALQDLSNRPLEG